MACVLYNYPFFFNILYTIMREEILKLEKSASVLEPNKQERAKIRDKVIEYTEGFLE